MTLRASVFHKHVFFLPFDIDAVNVIISPLLVKPGGL